MSQIIADTLQLIADNQDVILSAMRLAATNKEITMATLKISDLSVGDWVQDNYGNYVKVAGIWQDGNLNYQVDILRDGRIGTIVPCNIHPIPITAEILEKNGIHRAYEDDNYAIASEDGLWVVKYSDGDWELSTPPVCRVDIKYIHQLQHALRLAGLYEEINL